MRETEKSGKHCELSTLSTGLSTFEKVIHVETVDKLSRPKPEIIVVFIYRFFFCIKIEMRLIRQNKIIKRDIEDILCQVFF